MTRRLAPAVLALVLALVVGLPALAWAQDPSPTVSSLGDGIGGIGGGVLVVGVDKLLRYLADRDAKMQAKEDETKAEAARASVLRDLDRLRDLHNTLAAQVGRLDERQAAQAAQVHGDLARIGGTLDDIRDRLPPRP